MNVEWAIGELDKFITMTVMTNNSRSGPGYVSITTGQARLLRTHM